MKYFPSGSVKRRLFSDLFFQRLRREGENVSFYCIKEKGEKKKESIIIGNREYWSKPERYSFSPAHLIYRRRRRIPLSEHFYGWRNFLQFPKLFHPSILFHSLDPSIRSHLYISNAQREMNHEKNGKNNFFFQFLFRQIYKWINLIIFYCILSV